MVSRRMVVGFDFSHKWTVPSPDIETPLGDFTFQPRPEYRDEKGLAKMNYTLKYQTCLHL